MPLSLQQEEERKNLPKLLLVSDVMPQKNGFGASQTLYNLLDGYPKERLIILGPDLFSDKSELLQGFIFSYKSELIKSGRRFKLISKINEINRKYFPVWSLKKIKELNPDIILFCPVCEVGVDIMVRCEQVIKKRIINYHMDDWMNQMHNPLYHIKIKNFLDKNPWIVISEELKTILSTRYNISNSDSIVIHNPVSISNLPVSDPIQREKLKIIYAGSIWEMHLDALVFFSKVINKVSNLFELIIYTKEVFWENNKKDLIREGTTFGGFVPYSDLGRKLQEGNFLLVTSSFKENFRNHSIASLQTKTTDYMAAERPLIGVGPDYSICNKFIEENNIGLIFKNENLDEAVQKLKEISDNYGVYKEKGYNGKKVLVEKFSKEIVQNNFHQFLKRIN